MGRSPCCQKEGLKKGPWTLEEDEKLIAYVKEHGHGNWRALPQKCGLLRCGKSCRLRWTNYLRPDIKRGLFSHSEEQKIILLHALVGNKWAFIASQLPKRTDNEIKNFWNTVLRKRLNNIISSSSRESPAARGGGQATKVVQGKIYKKSSGALAGRSSSSSSSSVKYSCSNMQQGGIKSSSHLAQWESARLEAEARLAKESQSSKPFKLLSFNLGSNFAPPPPPPPPPPATITTTTTTTTIAAPCTTTTTGASPFCTKSQYYPSRHYPCTLAHLLSHASHPSTNITPSPASVTTPSSLLSSASLRSLSSQGSTSASALTLRPNIGRLSWKSQLELAFTSSPSNSQRISNTISKIDVDQQQQSAHKIAGHGSAGRDQDMEQLEQRQKGGSGGDHQLRSMQELITVDLSHSMNMSLPSADYNWQDLLFDVEDAAVVSTACRRSSQEILEPPCMISTSHLQDDMETEYAILTTSSVVSNNNTAGPSTQCSHMQYVPHVPSEASDHHRHALDPAVSCMDLDGLITLSHIDSLLLYNDHSANQHMITNALKDIMWDHIPTPYTRPSIS